MKTLALLALASLAFSPARAQDLNGAAPADVSQSAASLKKTWSGGAQAAGATPQEILAAWSKACPDISRYLASKTSSGKKGAGITTSYSSGPALLAYIRPSWYYTWTAVPVAGAGVEFVPLLQFPRSPADVETLRKELGALPQGTERFLGFNEPDIGFQYKKDGQMISVPPPTVQQAEDKRDILMAMIPRAVENNLELGSPALASPVLGKQPAPWLQNYLKDSAEKSASSPGARTDFIAVHLYSSIAISDEDTPQQAYDKVMLAAKGLTNRLDVLERAYPAEKIWITEMGLMDGTAKDTHHPLFTAKDDACFMAKVLNVLDNDGQVARYAWFSADPQAKNPLYPTLPGALFSEGRPTPLADLYR